MTRAEYNPGPANLAHVDKNGDAWTLVLVKELRHSPEKVWGALTDPAQLKEWAPFDADRNLSQVGTARLTTLGAPKEHITETQIKEAVAPTRLVYDWGGGEVRWELEPNGTGTRLTLWANIDRRFIAMGAAGWQVCLGVMELLLDGQPIGRIVAGDALQFEGWQRLHREYSEQFGVESPKW